MFRQRSQFPSIAPVAIVQGVEEPPPHKGRPCKQWSSVMKAGRSLSDLAAEIQRQHEAKHDYIADTRKIVIMDDATMAIDVDGARALPITDIAHGQIAEHVKIPKPYYDRMVREAPALLATNVNTWFTQYPAVRLVRTLDDKNRAFLSDAYRPLDNFDFANVILDVVSKRKMDVLSCEVTDKRLYIKAVDEKLSKDVPVGYKMGDGSHKIFDTCAPVFIASNSEVGYGRLVLDTGVFTRACTNMALWADGGMKRTHLGSRHKVNELTGVDNIDHLLTHKTRQVSDEALWRQLRDVLAAGFEPERITKRLTALQQSAERQITGNPVKVMELVNEKFGLTEDEGGSILAHLIRGGSLTQYALHAAVTRSAQDVESYDRATELEYLGGKIIELPQADWRQLAEAA